VIFGIHKNKDVNDVNSAFTVLEPGKIVVSTAQTINAMMFLRAGDTVDVRLSGVDFATFVVLYSQFSGFLISR